ncbi:basic form of pathogenesis-related protein 1-like [Lycium ferocissimum]|uniref:basic form of pathogenesis-related protein 1-like n=1 Tax=Lycium ferocissimum TaxID=112874 RepID=UPI00281546AA|nr:basic form of pathogenesis-related protein 1-like [Lycium ferocissimum]
MGFSNVLTTLVVCFITFAIFHSSQAQDSPQDYLNAHNAARRRVGVGPMKWDNRVAAFAQNYANKRIGDCRMQHSGGPYGENLAAAFPQLHAAGAVKMWVDEKQWYNYNSNTCQAGKVCGHYTQVVWRNSVRLGCARVRCNNGWYFITCNYDPPGNWRGQRPYGDLEEQPAFDSKLELPTDV